MPWVGIFSKKIQTRLEFLELANILWQTVLHVCLQTLAPKVVEEKRKFHDFFLLQVFGGLVQYFFFAEESFDFDSQFFGMLFSCGIYSCLKLYVR